MSQLRDRQAAPATVGQATEIATAIAPHKKTFFMGETISCLTENLSVPEYTGDRAGQSRPLTLLFVWYG
jgi:hypothetical protein